METPILSLANLSRTIGNKHIVHNLSFSFYNEQIYTVIGPSGAGKSSLLRLINRLDEPTSGKIRFHDKNQNEYSAVTLRQKIGFLFQTPHLFEKTVFDNLLFANNTLSNKSALMLLDEVNLSKEMLNRPVENLSIGEKQRVALARLLVTKPEIILLDEPTSALDPSITDAIEKLIKEIVCREKLTAIVVTHHPEQALRIGQEALLMVDGELVESGTVDDIINNPKTEFGKRYKAKELR